MTAGASDLAGFAVVVMTTVRTPEVVPASSTAFTL